MTPGARLKFRSAILRELVIFVFLVPFVVAGLGFTLTTFDTWLVDRDLRAHRRVSSQKAGRNTVRHEGTATRAQEVVAPSGARGIAWVAAVGYMARGKKSTWFEPICTRADVSDVDVIGGAGSLRLTFARSDDAIALAPTGGLTHREAPQLDLGELAVPSSSSEIPKAMQTTCASAMAKTKEPLLYREAVLFAGRHLEVLACSPDGTKLAPCNDGLDLVTVRDIDARFAERRTSTGVLAAFGGAWNLFVFGVIAAILSERIVRAKLSIEEAAKRAAG